MANPSWDPSGTYTQVFDDEFTGSSLDTTKWGAAWQASTGTSPPVDTSDETAGYNSSHVTVSGGFLNLLLNNTGITVGGHTYPHTAGAVTTDTDSGTGGSTGFTFQFGAVEARVFIPPPTSGSAVPNWPSWWMVNPASQQSSGSYLEIDLMEGLGGGTSYHLHWEVSSANQGSLGVWIAPQTGWHTIGCNWTSGQVDYYYDGVLAGTLPAPQSLGTVDLFLAFINTIANAIPSGVAGPNQTPSTEQVDWVRVWTAGPAAAIPAMSSLADDFTTPSTLQSLWGGSTVTANFGDTTISGSSANVNADSTTGQALQSGTVYDLTGSVLAAEITVASGAGTTTGLQATNGSGSPWPSLDGIPAQTFGASVTWQYAQSTGLLTAILSQGATDTTVGSVTYSATTHKWWRIRESGGTLFWDTSPDGTTWTNRFSHTYTIPVTQLFAAVYTIATSDESTTAHVLQVNGLSVADTTGAAAGVTATSQAGASRVQHAAAQVSAAAGVTAAGLIRGGPSVVAEIIAGATRIRGASAGVTAAARVAASATVIRSASAIATIAVGPDTISRGQAAVRVAAGITATAAAITDAATLRGADDKVAKAGDTMTGPLTVQAPVTAAGAITSGVVVLTWAATITPDARLGGHFRVTLAGATTINAPAPAGDGQKITLEIAQDGTGGRTVTWGAGFRFGPAGPPSVTSTAGKRDVAGFAYSADAGAWLYAGVRQGFT